jgi:hypothetical protein
VSLSPVHGGCPSLKYSSPRLILFILGTCVLWCSKRSHGRYGHRFTRHGGAPAPDAMGSGE